MPISDIALLGAVNGHQCFIHTALVGGQQSAQHVVGQIVRQGTGDRLKPPPCLSGFDTDYTPFAKGHVMALELGGCDETAGVGNARISANIVPQYEKWQGVPGGAWRDMEVAVGADVANSAVFIADITYQAGLFPDTYAVQSAAFNSGDVLMHWREPRIPERFRVWGVPMNWNQGGVAVNAYFAANDGGKDAAIANIIAALTAHGAASLKIDATIAAMPQTDRDYWRNNQLKGFARAEFRDAETIRDDEIEARTAAVQMVLNGRKRTRGSSAAAVPGPVPQPLHLANWIADNNHTNAMVATLQAGAAMPVALRGWTAAERLLLNGQHIRAAMLQA